jgi:hypothetical protein
MDAGAPIGMDAAMTVDAGNPLDGGLPTDAGTAADASDVPDAGSSFDAGDSPDAAVVLDAGPMPDAGSPPDAGQPPDSGPPIDGGPAPFPGDGGSPLCSALQVIRDDFEDNVRGPVWASWSNEDNGSVVETSGALVLAPDPAPAGDVNLNYKTVFEYNLTDSGITAHVNQSLNNVAGTAETFLTLQGQGSNHISIYVDRGDLHFFVREAGQSDVHQQIAYNATDHAHWRIWEGAGQINFDTSPNGATWSNRASSSTPYFSDLVQVIVGVWASSGLSGLGQAHFESISLDLEPAVHCPVSSRIENFSSTVLNGEWFTKSQGFGCTRSVSGGQLELDFNLPQDGYCLLSTPRGFSFTDDTLIVELVAAPSDPRASAGVALWSDEGLHIEYVVHGDDVNLYVERPPQNPVAMQDPGASGVRYLKLRHDAGILYASWSADGNAFNEWAQFSIPDASRPMEITLGTWAEGTFGGSVTGSATFDNLNIAP